MRPAAFALAFALLAAPTAAQEPEAIRLVFVGDTGYGTGDAEWGNHGQQIVAQRMGQVAGNPVLKPDLVYFLGDNVYWTGSRALFRDRFDRTYADLIESGSCTVHAVLGNHDVKNCSVPVRAVDERRWKQEAPGWAERIGVPAADLLAFTPGPETRLIDPGPSAYTNHLAGGSCSVRQALAHLPFGYGYVQGYSPERPCLGKAEQPGGKGTPRLDWLYQQPPGFTRDRYHALTWPLAGGADGRSWSAAGNPFAQVLALDSNTLDVGGGQLPLVDEVRAEDTLQLFWAAHRLARTGARWNVMAMHHPPHSPRGCALAWFGSCVGGHESEPGLQRQLRRLVQLQPGLAAGEQDAEAGTWPDFVVAAHNHFYSRSHPLTAWGERPSTTPGGAEKRTPALVRYFVSGGGGGPLYSLRTLVGPGPGSTEGDAEGPTYASQFAAGRRAHQFLYMYLRGQEAFYWAVDSNDHVIDAGCFKKGDPHDCEATAQFEGQRFSKLTALPTSCDRSRPPACMAGMALPRQPRRPALPLRPGG